MKFCMPHWQALRKAIDDRGLTALISKDGATATQRLKAELQEAPERETFDPLMSAHWGIVNNALRFLEAAGGKGAALNLLGGEICPVCECNRAHEQTCTDPKCGLDKKAGYDWMVDRAADDSLERARTLGLAPRPV